MPFVRACHVHERKFQPLSRSFIFSNSWLPPRCETCFEKEKILRQRYISLSLSSTKDSARVKNINDKFRRSFSLLRSRYSSSPPLIFSYTSVHAGRLISFIIFYPFCDPGGNRKSSIRAISYINTAINSRDDRNTWMRIYIFKQFYIWDNIVTLLHIHSQFLAE